MEAGRRDRFARQLRRVGFADERQRATQPDRRRTTCTRRCPDRAPHFRRSSMIDPNDPPRGSMYLYDDIVPPTLDGSYQLTVSTEIDYGTAQTASITEYFDVVGPRFTLDPTLIASVFPPRNGQGSYDEALPLIVFSRRTLPWERRIDSNSNPLPKPSDNNNPPEGDVPWIALLLLEEGEYTLLRNQTL